MRTGTKGGVKENEKEKGRRERRKRDIEMMKTHEISLRKKN